MNIKKGDIVIIKTGKDRGGKGKVLRALPAVEKILVEGINIRRRRQRARRSGEKGQMIEKPLPISVSNAMIFCSSCNQGTRVAKKADKNGRSLRVCAKCGKEF